MNISIAKNNITLAQKDTFSPPPVKTTYGCYHLQCIHNKHLIIRKQSTQPHLEIDFLLDSGATLCTLNTDTWNEIKEYHKLQLKGSTFVLSAAKGTIKLTHYTEVTDSRTLKNTSFTITFHVSNTKFNILSTPFLEKYVDSIKCSSHTLDFKDNNDIKSLKLYDLSTKPPPYYSRLFPVIGDHSIYFTPSDH